MAKPSLDLNQIFPVITSACAACSPTARHKTERGAPVTTAMLKTSNGTGQRTRHYRTETPLVPATLPHMIPVWLHDLSIAYLSHGALSALIIAFDLVRHPQHMWIMNVVSPVILVHDADCDAVWICHGLSGQLVADQKWHQGKDVTVDALISRKRDFDNSRSI
jgi:hypothetical protein